MSFFGGIGGLLSRNSRPNVISETLGHLLCRAAPVSVGSVLDQQLQTSICSCLKRVGTRVLKFRHSPSTLLLCLISQLQLSTSMSLPNDNIKKVLAAGLQSYLDSPRAGATHFSTRLTPEDDLNDASPTVPSLWGDDHPRSEDENMVFPALPKDTSFGKASLYIARGVRSILVTPSHTDQNTNATTTADDVEQNRSLIPLMTPGETAARVEVAEGRHSPPGLNLQFQQHFEGEVDLKEFAHNTAADLGLNEKQTALALEYARVCPSVIGCCYSDLISMSRSFKPNARTSSCSLILTIYSTGYRL